MKNRNILITFGVLGIAVILYKLLLGFVLPIALFVSLGYVLKFLIKGSVSDSDTEENASQILTNSDPTSVNENIVEIKPIKENKTIEELKPSEEDKLVDEAETSEDEKTADS
tara:strand:- start:564 stop:899 length:336 start_codon:yes stop_codon:yes gene_type:complete